MAEKDIIKVTVAVERIRFYKNEWGIIECSINKIKEGIPKLDRNGIAIFKGVMPQLQEKNFQCRKTRSNACLSNIHFLCGLLTDCLLNTDLSLRKFCLPKMF